METLLIQEERKRVTIGMSSLDFYKLVNIYSFERSVLEKYRLFKNDEKMSSFVLCVATNRENTW